MVAPENDADFGEALASRMAPYTGVASWGSLVMAVMVGKFVRFKAPQVRARSVPACVVGGVVGYLMWNIVHQVPGPHALDWRDSWDECSLLLKTLVFASLFLSLPMPSTLVAVLREGMPQLLYGQVLCWGQYVVVLLAGEVMRYIYPSISPLTGVMVAVGVEGGWSTLLFGEATIFPYLSDEANNATPFAHSACAIGLVLSIALVLVLINLPIECNPLSRKQTHKNKKKRKAKDDLGLELRAPSHDHVHEAKQSLHSLGLHVGLVTLASFLAYLLQVMLVGIDVAVRGPQVRVIAVVPLFTLTMVTAHLLAKVFRRPEVAKQLNRATFARLCITLLEMQVVLDLAAVQFTPLSDLDTTPKAVTFVVLMAVVVVWNLFGLFVLAPWLCPNHPFMRGVAEGAQLLGLTWTGLLWVRVMDPTSRTPVLMAYASKQIVHNLFMSGGLWSTHVVTMADRAGVWPTFGCAVGALLFWCAVYWFYVLPKMPARGVRTRERSTASRGTTEGASVLCSPEIPASSLRGIPSTPILSRSPVMPSPKRRLSAPPDMSIFSGLSVLPLPSLHGASSVFNAHAPAECKRLPLLFSVLPVIAQTRCNWDLVYNLGIHGCALRTLYQRCADYVQGLNSDRVGSECGNVSCVVVVEDSWGYVFGAYCTELPLHGDNVFLGAGQRPGRYFGDGNCFVFTFEPTFEFWGWSGQNECFALAREGMFVLGGPEPAILLDENLECGRSERSSTYGNRRLSCFKDFHAVTVEVWALQP